jgi:tetratricopeptide (TPR) repeat protein
VTFARSIRLTHWWQAPAIVGLLALTLGLIHLAEVRSNPFFYNPIVDAFDYDNDAWYMARTGDWADGTTVYFQAPLFVYLLAVVFKAVGHNLLWPRLVQVLMGGLTAAGVLVLARRLFGGKAAWIAGLATAFYGPLVFYQSELLAPTLTVLLDVAVLLVFFLVAWPRPGWPWAASGVVFGLRALATTNNLAALPVFWLWAVLRGRCLGWTRRQMALSALAFTLATAAAIAPVTLRNWVVGRQLVLVSSNAGLNFYLGNSGDYKARVGLRPGAEWEELMNRPMRAGARTESQMSSYYSKEARKYIRTHPGDYCRLLLYKTYLLLRGDEVLRNQEIYAFRQYSTVLRLLLWKFQVPGGFGLAFPFGLLLPVAWLGLLVAVRRRSLEAGLLAAFSVVYALSVVAFFVTARYRLPMVIPMILLGSYGLVHLRDLWSSGRLRIAAAGGALALLLLSNWNSGPMSKEMNPDAYFSLASTLARNGDLSGAEQYYKKAIALDPGNADARVNLGLEIYEARGMLVQAEACYRDALTLRPNYALALFNLGHLAELQGRPAEAESLYWKAARQDSLIPGPYQNLAAIALARGEYASARQLYREARLRNPFSAPIVAGLAVTTFKTEGLEAALPLFREATALDPGDADTYYNLAMVYAQAGLPSQAAEAARRVIDLNPEDNQAYVIFAEAMRAAGRSAEALRVITDAARRRPDLSGPREALKRLGPATDLSGPGPR